MSFATNTPVQFLPGVGRRTAQVLHSLGVHTAGQLNRVPEPLLTELFGPSIRQVLRNLYLPRQISPVPSPAADMGARELSEQPESSRRPFGQRLRLAAQLVTML